MEAAPIIARPSDTQLDKLLLNSPATLTKQTGIAEHGLSFAPATVMPRIGAIVPVPDSDAAGVELVDHRRAHVPLPPFAIELRPNVLEDRHGKRVKSDSVPVL